MKICAKTEQQIREMIEVTREMRNAPCDCERSGNFHNHLACIAGGRMMDSTIEALLWVLGTDSGFMDRQKAEWEEEKAKAKAAPEG